MTLTNTNAWIDWLATHHESTFQYHPGDQVRVVCPCGWESELFTDKRRADYAMDNHTRQVWPEFHALHATADNPQRVTR